MPRFVILEHDHPELHWDLMLEAGATLRTWRLVAPPHAPGEQIAAVALPDHRLHYLDYEGAVSGNRGSVKRWDTGWYEDLAGESDTPALAVHLAGTRVHGRCRLMRVAEDRWVFEWID